jgi:tetratricopeptide (TPR) repeat protein
VVRAPSHYRPYVKDPNAPTGGDAGGGMGNNNRRGRGNQEFALRDPNPGDKQVAKVDAKAAEEYKNSPPRRLVTAKEWQDALAKDDIKPEHRTGMLIAAVKFLGEVKQFQAVQDLIKGNLRLGVANEPWVYDALAIALQDSGGSPEDLQRARLSAMDLDPKNPDGYLSAAKAMSDAGDSQRAVAFCRIASQLKPGLADPYANALAYASKAKSVDSDTVHWAVINLLGRDWVIDKEIYFEQARSGLADAKARLLADKRPDDARKLDQAVVQQQRRDLVIELEWSNDTPCDLDLSVFEPINTTCSSTQRQTPAGGTLVCDDISAHKETYTVAKGFTGTYLVKVNRVWGRPLSGNATVKVTRHQGTDEQVIEYHTVNVDKTAEFKVALASGRRTELAAVPPVAPGHPEREKAVDNMGRALERLRAIADPLYRNDMSVVGGMGPAGTKPQAVYDLAHSTKSSASLSFQTKVEGVENMGVEMVERVEVVDGKFAVKVTPAFDAIGTLKNTPEIVNPLLPSNN